MDTSETYIKMCETATEIQPHLDNDGVGGTWVGGNILYHVAPMNQPHDRDGYYQVTDERAIRQCKSCGNREEYVKASKAIWLPRQDQLQEMVGGNPESLINDLNDWLEWIDFTIYNEYAKQFTSMEQLWLAFVMKEKYNKTWDGEQWQ